MSKNIYDPDTGDYTTSSSSDIDSSSETEDENSIQKS